MSRKLVIFDLDETLVHATIAKLASEPTFEVAPYFVYQRPGVHELLEFAAEHFDLAVWSSSSDSYVAAVVDQVFGAAVSLKFAWSVAKCVQRVDAKTNGYVYIKDLRKVRSQGYELDRITIVDDSVEKIIRQPRNHLLVKPFHGEQDDVELKGVQAALLHLLMK